MEFQVLGRIAVRQSDELKKVGGAKQRTLLAMLIVHAGQPVSTGMLIDALYDDPPPRGARRSVQTFVSNLRRSLGDVIVRDGDGYRIDQARARIDAVTFDELVGRARNALDTDPAGAAKTLRTALALWRGRPYEDVDARGHLEAETARLEELRLIALETRIEADLTVGAHQDVIAELESLSTEHPYRERFTCQLMVALYRAGRQAEALRACNRLRARLVEELGIEPTAATRELEQRILEQDADLAVPSERSPDGPLHSRGKFEMLDRIGAGRFSIVYRARQPAVGRHVAVKVIRSEYAHDPEFLRRFEREAQVVASLEHPHVVPIVDYWRDPDGAYLAMRLYRGGSLAEALELGPWPLDRAIGLVDQIASALSAAHNAGVLHRDIKPANILLDEAGNGALGDFGIAAIVGSATTFTDEGRTPTTPAYAAPEILVGEAPDRQSDVYSLAIVAYEALTGLHPFRARSVEALVARQLSDALPSLAQVRPDLPPALDVVLAAATAKDPAMRTNDAAQFALDLRTAAGLGGTPGTDRTPAAAEAIRSPSLTDFITEEMPFGPIAMDEISTPEVYEALYDADNRIHREIMRRRPSFIVGRRGAGKTALMRVPILDPHNLLIEFTSADLFAQVLSCVTTLEARGASVFVKHVSDLWDGVIWSGLCLAVLQRVDIHAAARADAFTVQRYVAGLGGPGLPSIDAAGAAFCRAVAAAGDGAPPSLESTTIGGVSPTEAKEACRRILDAASLNPVVLIDSMEDLHTELTTLSRGLAGLCGLVGHADRSARPECDFRLCYPSELWVKLADFAANPLKDAENHITLHWHAKELVKMAGNRLAIYLRLHHPQVLVRLFERRSYNPASYDDAKRVLAGVLPPKVRNALGGNEATMAYVMRHTQLLPRHLLWILNGVMRRNRELGGEPTIVSPEAVVDGVRRVEELLVAEVFSAYSVVHPAAREVCRRALPELPFSFTDGDLHRTYNRTGIAKKTGLGYFDFKELLVEIGAVGRVLGRTERYVEGEFDYTMPTPLYPAHEDALCLHPVFARVFQARPQRGSDGDEPLPVYPFGSDPDQMDAI
jgi:serine/threonine protein kinase/DNA-binding SARP family transcriptional activator